jgi:hypothetical protein
MSNDATNPGPDGTPKPPLTPEARRALAEAEERRRLAAASQPVATPEVGGRDGPDPARFGDWEKGGIASDF